MVSCGDARTGLADACRGIFIRRRSERRWRGVAFLLHASHRFGDGIFAMLYRSAGKAPAAAAHSRAHPRDLDDHVVPLLVGRPVRYALSNILAYFDQVIQIAFNLRFQSPDEALPPPMSDA